MFKALKYLLTTNKSRFVIDHSQNFPYILFLITNMIKIEARRDVEITKCLTKAPLPTHLT